jgi:hypothetical protein
MRDILAVPALQLARLIGEMPRESHPVDAAPELISLLDQESDVAEDHERIHELIVVLGRLVVIFGLLVVPGLVVAAGSGALALTPGSPRDIEVWGHRCLMLGENLVRRLALGSKRIHELFVFPGLLVAGGSGAFAFTPGRPRDIGVWGPDWLNLGENLIRRLALGSSRGFRPGADPGSSR